MSQLQRMKMQWGGGCTRTYAVLSNSGSKTNGMCTNMLNFWRKKNRWYLDMDVTKSEASFHPSINVFHNSTNLYDFRDGKIDRRITYQFVREYINSVLSNMQRWLLFLQIMCKFCDILIVFSIVKNFFIWLSTNALLQTKFYKWCRFFVLIYLPPKFLHLSPQTHHIFVGPLADHWPHPIVKISCFFPEFHRFL